MTSGMVYPVLLVVQDIGDPCRPQPPCLILAQVWPPRGFPQWEEKFGEALPCLVRRLDQRPSDLIESQVAFAPITTPACGYQIRRVNRIAFVGDRHDVVESR
jgi:hypothetical protein